MEKVATDMYGSDVSEGDTVKISGSSNRYIVDDIGYDGDMLELTDERSGTKMSCVNSNQVIKVG